MMYQSKLVASIKANGKILREFKDKVYVPFGSEYSILLKNLNIVRATINIYIDGENVVPNGLVLNPGQEVDLERSIKNNNLTEGNRFKFIERSGAVEKHRGAKLEDGLVRIEYQFEKIYKRQDGPQWNTTYPSYNTFMRGVGGSSIGSTGTVQGMSLNSIQCSTVSAGRAVAQSVNNVGITVPGSKSNQTFTTVGWFAVEDEKHNIILQLLGETEDNKLIQKPVTTKHKPKCITCGKQNKATAKFCTECGTALEIFA